MRAKEFKEKSELKWQRRAEEDERKKELKKGSRSRTTERERAGVASQGRHTTLGNVAHPLSTGTSSSKLPQTPAPTTATKKQAAPAPISQPSPPSTPAAQKTLLLQRL